MTKMKTNIKLIAAFLYKHLTARLPQGESGYSAFFTYFKHLKENSTKENRCQHHFLLLCYQIQSQHTIL